MYEDDADLRGNPPLQLWQDYLVTLRALPEAFKDWEVLLDSRRETRVGYVPEGLPDGIDMGDVSEGPTATPKQIERMELQSEVTAGHALRMLEKCYRLTHELLRYDGLPVQDRMTLREVWVGSDYTPPKDLSHRGKQLRAQLIKSQFLTPERTSQIVDLRYIAERKVAELCEVKAEDAKAGSAPEPEYTSMTGKGMMNGKSANSMSKEALALATLADHPDWTNAQIAEAVGCNVKSLPRMSKFSKARIALASSRVELPKGWKGNSGSMESYDDD